jgi:hypothetical protein
VNRSRLLPRRRVFQSRQASVGRGPRPLPSLRPTNQRRRLGQSPSLEPRRRRQRSVSSTALDRRGQRKTDPAIKSNGARASSLGPVVAPALSPVRVNSRPPPFLPSPSRHVKWPLRPCTSPFLTRIVCSVRCCCSLEYKGYLLALRGNLTNCLPSYQSLCSRRTYSKPWTFFTSALEKKERKRPHRSCLCDLLFIPGYSCLLFSFFFSWNLPTEF